MKNDQNCVICGKPGEIFVSFVTGTAVYKKTYCAKHGHLFTISDSCYEFVDEQNPHKRQMFAGIYCKNCGYSNIEFQETKLFGCENCFENMKVLIDEEFAKSYKENYLYMGKFPKNKKLDKITIKKRKQLLKDKMTIALKRELYEDAEDIKLQLKNLAAKPL